jgi:hypothetical protein
MSKDINAKSNKNSKPMRILKMETNFHTSAV